MKHSLYVVRDVLSGQYGEVMQCYNDDVVTRVMIPALASGPDWVSRDSEILCVGEVTDANGYFEVSPVVPNRLVLRGSDPRVISYRKEFISNEDEKASD